MAVNTTTFADKDDNGNTFFVQTTFTQMINDNNNNNNLPALPSVETVADDYYVDAEGVTEADVTALFNDADYGTDYEVVNEAESETASESPIEDDNVLPIEDPSFNEINDGIDTGLKQE